MHHKYLTVRRTLLGAVLSLAAFAVGPVHAQAAFPSKNVRIVVPFAAGGVGDLTARIVAQKLAELLGQSVVIENRPGAGGVVAADTVARAEPDGHTMFLMSNGTAVTAGLFKSLPFDTVKDFTPVATFATADFLLAVNPKLAATDLPSFIALAKTRAGGLNYGMVGSAGIGRINGELFSMNTGLQFTQIPFKGSAQMLTSLMSGDIDFVIDTANVYLQHIAAGKVRPIAVPGNTRLVGLPDVPTFAEGGMPQFDVRMWFGVLAPAGVPPAVVEKLSTEFARVVALPEVRDRRDLDLAIAERKVPAIKGRVQVKLLPLGPWSDGAVERRIESVPPALMVPPVKP